VAASLAEAAAEFADLARNLQLVGAGELRAELYKAISGAAKPVADEIKSLANLEDHMPNRYAAVLARDLRVTTSKRTTGAEAGVTIMARAPTLGRGGRKITQRNAGRITHPEWGQGPRRTWRWSVQERGMRPGFFDDPAQAAAPQVRKAILAAMSRIADKAVGR
jgi:hypothetical protein